jgi:hypothetical protein
MKDKTNNSSICDKSVFVDKLEEFIHLKTTNNSKLNKSRSILNESVNKD